MKKSLFSHIDNIKGELTSMADYIFDNPEIGLEEVKSSKLLIDWLNKNDFETETGLAGMNTAFRAIYKNGSGGPSIGLLCEYDAIEGMGHACGHHMQGPAILGAAKAIKEVLKNEPYKLVVYGTPAEETIGAKINMIKEGYFQDIDVALMMHASPTTTTDVKSLAMSNFNVIFHGTSAHAALAPEQGRSALDGLLLLFQGIEFMREHVKEDTRMHYTITNAGGPANVVPKIAEAKFSLRSYDRNYLNTVIERFKNVVEGAGLMTETKCEIIETKSLDNKIPVLKLNEILMDNATAVDAPRMTPPRQKTGSSDFGNVMFQVPGSCIRVAFVPVGTSSHSEEYITAGKNAEAHDATIIAAKVLAASSFDMITNPELMKEIREEFIANKEERKLA